MGRALAAGMKTTLAAAYDHLIDLTLRVLERFIPQFEAAEEQLAYEEAVQELAAHIPDCHTGIGGLTSAMSQAWPPFIPRLIEGQAVVEAVSDEAKKAGLHVGDVIVEMDGEPMSARIARAQRFVASSTADERLRFSQPLPASDQPYRGKTFMLVDERTISQAEHTALFLEAAAGIQFVGSQTAGTDGDVTNVILPGGLTPWFTGHDVRHADGSQLQRIGLPIHHAVRSTIKGLRAGRDEVLERAIALARSDAR
jgi:C-terminal processing protease CtpA/Prc